jgi:hypothetical protein
MEDCAAPNGSRIFVILPRLVFAPLLRPVPGSSPRSPSSQFSVSHSKMQC